MNKSPYKGLSPYSEIDRLFFFGREKDREKITKQLKAWPLTVLYGASGVGKSSVLRAGVAYHFSQVAQKNVDTTGKPGQAIIVFPAVEGKLAKEVSWQDPLNGIKKQLQVEIAKLLDVSPTEIEEKFEAEIASLFPDKPSPPPNRSLVHILKALAKIIRDEEGNSRLFIILDQFEEYLVQLRHKKTDNAFLDEFQKAVNSSEVSVNFLISIREDSLAILDRFVNIQNRFKHLLAIEHLNEESAREAILKPVVEYNRQKIILEKFLDDLRLTILAGNIDTHKSTILRSAIVPYLKEHGLNVIFFNSWRRCSQQQDLLVVFKSQLLKALDRSGSFPSPKQELSLVETLNTWIKHINGKQSETRLFVILDQFEEYFWKPQETDPDQKFINELLSAINDNSLNIKFLISIREEWLPALDPYKDRLPDSCQYYLQLNAQENNFIEEKPIDLNKVNPKEQKKRQQKLEEQLIHIEPNLDKYILEEFKKEKKESKEGVKPNQDTANEKYKSETKWEVETPYLQLVMTSLWNEEKKSGSKTLRRETFKELGSLRGIVQRYFDRKISSLSPEEADIAGRIFYHLVTHSGIKIALPVGDLYDYANSKGQRLILSYNQVEDLVNKLSDINPSEKEEENSKKEEENYRILRSVPGSGGERLYEIFHDVLAKPILAWLAEKEEQEARQKAIQKGEIWGGAILAILVVLAFAVSNNIARSKFIVQQLTLEIEGASEVKQISGLLRAIPAENQLLSLLKKLKWRPWVRVRNDKDQLKSTLTEEFTNIREKNILPVSPGSPVRSVSYEGNRLAASSDDGTISLWEIQDKEWRKILVLKLLSPVYSVSLSQDGNRLAAGSDDGTVRLWNLQGQKLREIPVAKPERLSPVLSVSLSQDGNRLAAGSADGTLRLWDSQGQEWREITVSDPPESKQLPAVLSVSLSQDGNRLAAGSADGTLRLWDSQGQEWREITVSDPPESKQLPAVQSVSLSQDGNRLAAGYADGTVRLWDSQGQEWREITVSDPPESKQLPAVQSVSFSQDGNRLATGSTDGTVRLWDIQDKETNLTTEFKVKQGAVLSVSFRSDGKFLATGSGGDGNARLWAIDEQKAKPVGNSLEQLLESSREINCQWLEEYFATPAKDIVASDKNRNQTEQYKICNPNSGKRTN